MLTLIPNHYGYGLRNDEKPYAHKIPPGGNWRRLPRDDQVAFMKGAINSDGGKVGYLRRESWDAPSMTILTSPMAKATCQLHPGTPFERSERMTYNVTPQLVPNGFTVAELFAGGGLMAVGLRAAGYDLVWANDFDKNAVKAYRHNLGDHIVHGDITEIDIDSIPDADVVAGGPPCQDYSVAGTGAGEEGERGKLVWRYLEIIERKRPKAFVFENVKGLVGKKHKHTFEALIAKFEALGYTVSWQVVNAWDYGVAQKRERVFIVGIRNDLEFSFEFPEPRPEDYRTQVLRDVIGDLPEPYVNHAGYGLRNDEKPYADKIPPGGNWRNLSHVDQLVYWNGKIPTEGGSTNGLRRRDWDEPTGTITTTPLQKLSCQLHPQAPRRFTVRECLRIQSVPDWYVIPDDIKLSPQYRIVGNGVASRVSYLIGVALAEQLRKHTEIHVEEAA